MNQLDVLKSIFLSCNYKSYLELGIWEGHTLADISKSAENAIGVDIQDIRIDKTTNFFLGGTLDFFKQNQKTFDLIFIDADHNLPAVIEDLNESLKILNKYGTIAIHDTDPQHRHYLKQNYCSDSYKISKWLDDHNLSWITLPMNDCGMTIVRKKDDLRHLEFV
jgi:predicted O-methyltransferase YrrM